jgi:hypothetical protein
MAYPFTGANNMIAPGGPGLPRTAHTGIPFASQSAARQRLSSYMVAYILAWRGISVPGSANAPALLEMMGECTDEELEELAAWEAYAMDSYDVDRWVQEDGIMPTVPIAARALAQRTGHQCLIPVGFLTAVSRKGYETIGLRLLLAYYARRGLPCHPLPERLTDEQAWYAHLGGAPPTVEPLRVVVNAGPGTGKTTTAVELVREAVRAGNRVLILAYTNSAVTTLRKRISADPFLGGKYKSEPFGSKNAGKTFTAPVLLSTVDQMALAIQVGRAGIRTYGGATRSFDRTVEDALVIVRNDPGALGVFLENGQTPMFTHIVVDEGQMLSDSRAALVRAIARGLTTCGVNGQRSCHMTVFCDPKQTISENTGRWLLEMYAARGRALGTSPGDACRCSDMPSEGTVDGEKWQLGALSVSFRFETVEMQAFVMALSRKRPALHVELVPGVPQSTTGALAARARPLSDLAAAAEEVRDAYRSTRSVAILTPTMGRTNEVSRQVAALVLELRRLRVPVCLHGEDNFQAHGVMVVTFNSCAGMEFSHTFIMGASGYPKNYPQVTHEVGRSLVFIANSRAKRSVCYLLSKPELCMDLDKDMVAPMFDGRMPLEAYALPSKYVPRLPEYWTAETLFRDGSGSGGSLYMETNGIHPRAYVVDRSTSDPHVPLYEAISAFGPPRCLSHAEDVPKLVARINPGAAHLRGIASVGRVSVGWDGNRVMNSEGLPYALDRPPEGTSERDAFYWYSDRRPEPEGTDAAGRAVRFRDVVMGLLDRLSGDRDPKPRFCRQMMRRPANGGDPYVICPHLMFDAGSSKEPREGFLCFTDNPYQALFVGAALYMVNQAAPIIVQADPWQGVAIAYDGFHAAMGYQLDALRRIHVYTQTTIFRDNYLGVPQERRPIPNTFAIDTEYTSTKGSIELYEVGIVNMADPYRSLCAPVRSTAVDPGRIEKMGLVMGAYRAIALSLDDLLLRFLDLINRPGLPPPRVLYYSASADINWLQGTAHTINIAEVAAARTPLRGTFETDSRASNLDALYGMYVGPIDQSGRHQALPDAISLAEVAAAMLLD